MTMWKPTACQIDMKMIAGSAVVRVAQPVGALDDVEADGLQHVVDQAVRLVHEQPQHRHHHHRGDDRQEVDGAEEVDAAASCTLTSSASTSAKAGLHRHDDDREDDVLRSDFQNIGSCEEPGEVVEPDELGRARGDQPGVGEGQDEGQHDRDEEEQMSRRTAAGADMQRTASAPRGVRHA